MLGLGLGPLVQSIGPTPWTPASLLPSGVAGYWAGGYAPEPGRIWQNLGQSLAATAPNDPVATMLQRAGTASPSQATAADRPVLGSWPIGGRRNLLINTEFHAGVSGTLGALISGVDFHPYEGGLRLQSVGGTTSFAYRPYPIVLGSEYHFSCTVRMEDGSEPEISTATPDLRGFIGNTIAFTDKAYLGSGMWRLSVRRISSGSLINYVGVAQSAQSSLKPFTVSAYHLGLGSYQSVKSDQEVTETSRKPLWHLLQDGGKNLPITLPAGLYGLAYVDAFGLVTITTVTNPTSTLYTSRQLDVLLRQGAFTTAETQALQGYWRRYRL